MRARPGLSAHSGLWPQLFRLACNPTCRVPATNTAHTRDGITESAQRRTALPYRWNRHFSFSIPSIFLPQLPPRARISLAAAAEGAWAVGVGWSSRSPPALAAPRVLSSSPAVAHLWRHRRKGFHLPQAVGASGAVEVGSLESFLGLEGGDLGVAHLGLH